MGIYKEGHEIINRWREGHDLQETWKFIGGAWRLVWQAIRSCFGRGWWVNEKPWSNKDVWKN